MKTYELKEKSYDFESIYKEALKELDETGRNCIGGLRKGKHSIRITVSPALILPEERHELDSESDLEELSKKIGF